MLRAQSLPQRSAASALLLDQQRCGSLVSMYKDLPRPLDRVSCSKADVIAIVCRLTTHDRQADLMTVVFLTTLPLWALFQARGRESALSTGSVSMALPERHSTRPPSSFAQPNVVRADRIDIYAAARLTIEQRESQAHLLPLEPEGVQRFRTTAHQNDEL